MLASKCSASFIGCICDIIEGYAGEFRLKALRSGVLQLIVSRTHDVSRKGG